MAVHDRAMHRNSMTVRELVEVTVGVDGTALTASGTDLAQVLIPRSCFLERIGVWALGAVSGTTPTLLVTARQNGTAGSGTSLLATGTITASGWANRNFATESMGVGNAGSNVTPLLPGDYITIDTTITGTTPSFAGVRALLILRTGGPDVLPGSNLAGN